MSTSIPFNRALLVGREAELLRSVFDASQWAGNGDLTVEAERILAELHAGRPALLTTSCTSALEVTALLLDLGPGDEIIVPSFTFVSSAAAFSARGAKIVFADIRPDTFNIDERLLADLVTDRTRAIVVVHYGGVGAEMDEITAFAAARGITVVEDNAHGLLGRYRDQPLGTFGDFSAISFHATKNLTSGQGGALVLASDALAERARVVRENGTNRAAFERGEVDYYSWVAQGTNALPSELTAAVILGQLEVRELIQARRRVLVERYREGLGEWMAATGTSTQSIPDHCESANHIFPLILSDGATADRLIEHLRERDILAVKHYIPLHRSPMGRVVGPDADCPVSIDCATRLVRLPLFFGLLDDEQARVLDAVCSFGVSR